MNGNASRMQRLVDQAQGVWARCDSEGRNPTAAERREIEGYLDRVKSLRAYDNAIAQLEGRAPVSPTDPRAVPGDGWAALAKGIDIKTGKTKAEAPLAGLLRGKALSGADDTLGFETVRGPLVQLGADARYVYPVLARQPLAPQNLSVVAAGVAAP